MVAQIYTKHGAHVPRARRSALQQNHADALLPDSSCRMIARDASDLRRL
jgi:hypothetical protein